MGVFLVNKFQNCFWTAVLSGGGGMMGAQRPEILLVNILVESFSAMVWGSADLAKSSLMLEMGLPALMEHSLMLLYWAAIFCHVMTQRVQPSSEKGRMP